MPHGDPPEPNFNHDDATLASSNATGSQSGLDAWHEDEFENESFLVSDKTSIIVTSIVAHLIVVLTLALVQLHSPAQEELLLLAPALQPPPEPVQFVSELEYSDEVSSEMGADSFSQAEAATASAEMFSDILDIPAPTVPDPVDLGQIMVNQMFTQSVAPLERLMNQKGKVGEGTQGASGAIDRLTFEILKSMEERPTLVVWLFDQSGSLNRQRAEIIGRFDRIYEELGIVQSNDERYASKNQKDAPLLTSIVGFGKTVQLYNKTPTNKLKKIKQIISSIQVDDSGIENVFTAVEEAAREFKRFRRNVGGNGPTRNVLFVVVTDERGDDGIRLESSIASCRKSGIPVHVIGVPAPFGREHTFVKYIDPDTRFSQRPQWAQVDQGPETFFPERVQVGFTADFREEPTIDSGFGPYGLTRMCYETGGIYFTVHPNRRLNRVIRRGEVDPYASDLQYFFDPEIMARYRPDYLPAKDYVALVKSSTLRRSLVNAAQLKPVQGVGRPRRRFVKIDDARLAADLTRAQQDAAKLEPTLVRMAQTLLPGMDHRDSETSLRWSAGYDLAMGRVLAQKVRTETYNAMLAMAKRGMSFQKAKNNTWVLRPSANITVGSRWEREAKKAAELLNDVIAKHKGTPWAMLAKNELDVPIGWKWTETFTDLAPPRERPGNNPNPRPPQNDRARMIPRAPTRPVPKL